MESILISTRCGNSRPFPFTWMMRLKYSAKVDGDGNIGIKEYDESVGRQSNHHLWKTSHKQGFKLCLCGQDE